MSEQDPSNPNTWLPEPELRGKDNMLTTEMLQRIPKGRSRKATAKEIKRVRAEHQQMLKEATPYARQEVSLVDNYELRDHILRRVAEGETLSQIAKEPGMPSFSTVWMHMAKDDAFRKEYEAAVVLQTHAIANKCLELADDRNIPKDDRALMINTRLKLISKWNSRNYGDKVTQEHTGKDGGAIDIKGPSTAAQILALLAQNGGAVAAKINAGASDDAAVTGESVPAIEAPRD